MDNELLTKIRYIKPSYDRRNKDPEKNCGISPEVYIFAVLGEIGAVVFSIYSDNYLPHLIEELGNKLSEAHAGSISYHFYKCPEDWKSYSKSHKDCIFLAGKECYSDGAATPADELFKSMGKKINEDRIYWYLENLYNEAKERHVF